MDLHDHKVDSLARHLGHDIKVHREFYRLPHSAIDIATIGKLLVAINRGAVSNRLKSQRLDDLTISFEDDDSSSSSSSSSSLDDRDEPRALTPSPLFYILFLCTWFYIFSFYIFCFCIFGFHIFCFYIFCFYICRLMLIYMEGKRSRHVPVLLTGDMRTGIDMLIRSRKDTAAQKTHTFLQFRTRVTAT